MFCELCSFCVLFITFEFVSVFLDFLLFEVCEELSLLGNEKLLLVLLSDESAMLAALSFDTDACELAVLADDVPDVLFELHAASEHISIAEIMIAIVFFILKTSLDLCHFVFLLFL